MTERKNNTMKKESKKERKKDLANKKRICISNTNYLHTVIWFQVFLCNTEIFQAGNFALYMGL